MILIRKITGPPKKDDSQLVYWIFGYKDEAGKRQWLPFATRTDAAGPRGSDLYWRWACPTKKEALGNRCFQGLLLPVTRSRQPWHSVAVY